MKRVLQGLVVGVACVAVGCAGAVGAASAYYSSQRGAGCTNCHEMGQFVTAAHASGHRNLSCQDCHQENLRTKLRHISAHLTRNIPESIRMRDTDVVRMTVSCQKCHQQEYAGWKAGPHSATYARIFADRAQNAKQPLMDDCLRCHGMHFDGAVADLVQPQDLRGPWRVVRSGFADAPTMPCSACHWVHSEGAPLSKAESRISVAETRTQSLGFFDRREQMHFAAATLSVPQVYDGAKAVRMSPDARQGLCYQCHAPRLPDTGSPAAVHGWSMQAGSGDDRTPVGVHEGLSCFACHAGHNENARASCKGCHQRTSECGLDVEVMDTTYANASSKHNIHSVRCVNCHAQGVPRRRTAGSI